MPFFLLDWIDISFMIKEICIPGSGLCKHFSSIRNLNVMEHRRYIDISTLSSIQRCCVLFF